MNLKDTITDNILNYSIFTPDSKRDITVVLNETLCKQLEKEIEETSPLKWIRSDYLQYIECDKEYIFVNGINVKIKLGDGIEYPILIIKC